MELDIRREWRVGNEESERGRDATTMEQRMEESGKAEVGEASEAKMRVESFANDPRPVGGVQAEMRGLQKKGEERVTREIKDESLGGGPVHREEEGEGGCGD
jgi:hypothetical protein